MIKLHRAGNWAVSTLLELMRLYATAWRAAKKKETFSCGQYDSLF